MTACGRKQSEGGGAGLTCRADVQSFGAPRPNGREADDTSLPGALKPSEWPEIQFSNDAVVCDNKIITSRGPGTAMTFALTINEKLMDEETREQVETSLVIR